MRVAAGRYDAALPFRCIGATMINDASHFDRGFKRMDETLTTHGANVERVCDEHEIDSFT
jgi:UDP-N-acetylglucosamine enolpyruvyl transferase